MHLMHGGRCLDEPPRKFVLTTAARRRRHVCHDPFVVTTYSQRADASSTVPRHEIV